MVPAVNGCSYGHVTHIPPATGKCAYYADGLRFSVPDRLNAKFNWLEESAQ